MGPQNTEVSVTGIRLLLVGVLMCDWATPAVERHEIAFSNLPVALL